MAINTYINLQTAVADYLARTDLSTQITEFIQLTEAKLQRKFKGVTTLSGSNTTNWLLTAHPDAYLYGALLEAAPYLIDDARVPLWVQALDKVLAEIRLPNTGSNFANYAGLQLAVADWLDRPDIDVQIPNFIDLAEAKFQRKFRSVTSLSASNTTNWLLTAHPDLYLYGILLEATPYLKDDARIAVWKEAYAEAIAQVRNPTILGGFNSYATLQATISDWLNRPDLDNVIPTFILLAQQRLSRDLRLRTMLKVSTTTTVAGTATISLPTDYNMMRDIHIVQNPVGVLTYKSPSSFYINTNSAGSGQPYSYTILSSAIQLAPIPDNVYTIQMLYYAVPAVLSVSNTTNAYITQCPDLLLYASLSEAAPYLMDDGRLQTWATLYDRGLHSLQVSDDEGEYSGAPLSVSLSPR